MKGKGLKRHGRHRGQGPADVRKRERGSWRIRQKKTLVFFLSVREKGSSVKSTWRLEKSPIRGASENGEGGLTASEEPALLQGKGRAWKR